MSNAFNLSQLANNVNTSGLLQVAGGGTGVTTSTGTGNNVLSAGATLTNATITTSSTGLTFSDSSTQTAAASPYVLKNRIINGDMRIDQRNAGASVTPTSNQYTLDRWQASLSQTGKFSVQQNAGSVTPPAGFTNYLGCTSLSPYTVLSGDLFIMRQHIEGYNTSDLAWGTANAKTVTLSFWVRSSLTGTFGGVIQEGNAASRTYPFTYTISSANTWTQISVTIPGDTSGTWNTTNGISIDVTFSLGCGSTLLGTSGAWAGAAYYGATGQTNIVSTNGATWYITGVQLEIGTSATPFERRLYNQELANCQRYYAKSWDTNTAVGTAAGAQGTIDIVIPVTGTGAYRTTVFWPVEMRADPTVVAYDNSSPPVAGTVYKGGSGKTAAYGNIGTRSAWIGTADATSANELYFYWTSTAEL